ncbi:MAG: YraN family protein [Clostridiales bacterium]|nr:YraN family protein [Clostridiales bacterium]
MADNRQKGKENEERAVIFLENLGFKILEKNYHCSFGEIDIIAKENKYLVFVEVKYRKNLNYGTPHEAIDLRKQRRIYQVAKFYMYSKGYSEEFPCRFDSVLILNDKIELIRHSFGGI